MQSNNNCLLKVREEVIRLNAMVYQTPDSLRRYDYKEHDCVPSENVIANARNHLEKSWNNTSYENCQDFAMKCKTKVIASVRPSTMDVGTQVYIEADGDSAESATGKTPTLIINNSVVDPMQMLRAVMSHGSDQSSSYPAIRPAFEAD